MGDSKFPTLYLGKTVIKDDVFDFGESSFTASTPINDNDISNKLYVDDKIKIEANTRTNKDIELEEEVIKLKSMLDTLKTNTTTLLDSQYKKINDLYLVLYRISMDQAIGVDPNTFTMIFQYGPGTILQITQR
jgi:hypothetical protein